MIYKIESGIISSWFKKCGTETPVELFPVHWDLIGHTPAEVVLGKNSGIDSIWAWLEKTGYNNVGKEEANAILMEVKAMAYEKKALLTEDEFRTIASKVANLS